MFISHKSNVIQQIHEVEWQCRRITKGLNKSEYWAWEETIKDSDGVPDYSGETDYSIVETEVDVEGFNQSGHITSNVDGKYYHLKWNASEKKVVEDDDAKTAWELAEEWKEIRKQRTKLLAETDWVVIKARENGGTVAAKWKTYRVALRDLPAKQSAKTKYSDITWPTQPS